MNKKQLVSTIAETMGLEISKKDAGIVLDLVVSLVKQQLRVGRRFHLKDLGTFTVRTRRARMGTNPHTKRPMKCPAHRTVFFKPVPSFRREL